MKTGMIRIIGMGPGPRSLMAPASLDEARGCDVVFIRTLRHPAAEAFEELELGERLVSFDALYDRSESFELAYGAMAEAVLAAGVEGKDVAFVVPGSPAAGEVAVRMIIKDAADKGIPVRTVQGMSFIDACCLAVGCDSLVDGLVVMGAFRLDEQWPKSSMGRRTPFAVPLLIGEVYDRMMAGNVKLAIADAYGDEHMIKIITAAGDMEGLSVREVPTYELDRLEGLDHLTSVFVPGKADAASVRPSAWPADRIVDIMARLRGDDGCPWDKKQDLKSLRPYVLEEAYEVAEAIDEGDMDHLCEELGDLLLQVVFQARLAQEEGHFDFTDVVDAISEKLIRRHPHIFSDVEADTAEKVLRNWEYIKQQEKAEKAQRVGAKPSGGEEGEPSLLEGIANSLPALWYSSKMQDKAARVGFDWKTAEQAMAKVHEETAEVEAVLAGPHEKLEEEIGDLLFAVVNVARLAKIDAEAAAKKTAAKFKRRFMYIEAEVALMGEKIEDMGLERLDALWNEAKAKGI